MRPPIEKFDQDAALQVVDSNLMRIAEEHLRREDYRSSLDVLNMAIANCKTPNIADPVNETVEDAMALHLWNLLYLKELNEFDNIRDQIISDDYSESHLLSVVYLWREVENANWDLINETVAPVLSKPNSVLPRHLAEYYFLSSYAAAKLGEINRAIEHSEISRALFLVADRQHRAAAASNLLGILNLQSSRYVFALEWFRRASQIFEADGARKKLSMVHLNIGVTHYKTAHYQASVDHLEKSLAIGEEGGWIHRQCFANIALGNVRRLQRDFEAARRHLHAAYNQAQQLQYPREEALALEFLGDVYRDEEQFEQALRFYARALAIGERQAPEGDIVMEVHRRQGECLTALRQARAAAPQFARALELARAQGDRFEEGVTLREMARADLELGDPAGARERLDASVAVLDGIGARHEHGIALMASAELALSESEKDVDADRRGAHLDAAWRDATAALDRMLQVDVPWWTERARHLVDRVRRRRAERERAEHDARRDPGVVYDPGDVIIHASGRMRDLLQVTDMFAASREPVLITGETGTGKELFARRLHRNSGREGALVTVNVAAIPETVFEREFFGHVRGAFSGAERDGEGFAARADGGTLFLDEIGDLPLAVQPKLLRLLQEGTYQAIGDPAERRVDIRLVAATNADLAERVAAGSFREDLWYRLRILELELPPVRERREDVLPLLRHFLCRAAGRHVDLAAYFDLPSLEAAERWEWPGNAREIAMVAQRAHVQRLSGRAVHIEMSGRSERQRLVLTGDRPRAMQAAEGMPIPSITPTDLERDRIRRALAESGGNRMEAARRLGIGRSTLYRRMEKLGLSTRKS